MPEESTRKLLKLFGVAVTEFEDQTSRVSTRLGEGGPPSTEALELTETWLKVSDEAMAHWQEVTQFLMATQARGQANLARALARFHEASQP